MMTWAFVLGRGSSGTRLFPRVRGGPACGLPQAGRMAGVRPVHFIMQRKQLLEVACRRPRPKGRLTSRRGSRELVSV